MGGSVLRSEGNKLDEHMKKIYFPTPLESLSCSGEINVFRQGLISDVLIYFFCFVRNGSSQRERGTEARGGAAWGLNGRRRGG